MPHVGWRLLVGEYGEERERRGKGAWLRSQCFARAFTELLELK
jgi:hypothetical protein